MRNVNTILNRVLSDLPVTKKEYEACNKYLDSKIKEQKIVTITIFTIMIVVIVLFAVFS